MNYEVKLIVTETHYVNVKANNPEEASKIAEDKGVNSLDAHTTEIETESVIEVK